MRVGWCGGSWNASGVGEMACAALTSARLSLLYLFRAEKKLLTEAGTGLWLFRLVAVEKALPGSRWRMGALGSLQIQTWALFCSLRGETKACPAVLPSRAAGVAVPQVSETLRLRGCKWGCIGKGRAASKSCSGQSPTEHCWKEWVVTVRCSNVSGDGMWRIEGCAAVRRNVPYWCTPSACALYFV